MKNPLWRIVAEVTIAKAKKRAHCFVEAERYYDARAFGERVFGVPQVECTRVPESVSDRLALPRWEIRWEGNAVTPVSLRLQARLLKRRSDEKCIPFTDVRDAL